MHVGIYDIPYSQSYRVLGIEHENKNYLGLKIGDLNYGEIFDSINKIHIFIF